MVRNEEHTIQTQRNWFSRFTRGLSSSLAGLGAAKGSESSPTLSSLPEEEPQQLSSLNKTFMPPYTWSDNTDVPFSTADHNESLVKDVPSIPFPVLQVSQMRSLIGQRRQRLAGHITKIRLESHPVLETPNPIIGQNISETPREILDVSSLSALSATVGRTKTDIRFPMESSQAAKEEAQPLHLPIRNGMDKTGVGTPRHLPTGRMFKGNVRIVTRNPLCGSGEFSCGQRDVVVKNPVVRASSVIVVTLTSNPGPVVVQYVSLLPYEGFTVHLTASTTMHARFNYMILSSDLP
ncbi:MAG TPA: hypothetical protein VGL94_11155 [Ktedonobacteraceae bacterium]